MKAKGIILGLLIVGILSSCEEFDFDGLLDNIGVGFSTSYYDFDLAIPPVPEGVELSVQTLMHFDLEEELALNGYDNVTVNSIQISYASFEVMESSNIRNLNPVDFISFAVSTDNVAEETIASVNNTTVDAVFLPLQTTDSDLTDYLSDTEYTLITSGSFKESTTDTLWVKAKIRYRVSLGVSSAE